MISSPSRRCLMDRSLIMMPSASLSTVYFVCLLFSSLVLFSCNPPVTSPVHVSLMISLNRVITIKSWNTQGLGSVKNVLLFVMRLSLLPPPLSAYRKPNCV
jgi:hypothetical protein